MAYVNIVYGTPTWLPVVAADSTSGSPRLGITYNQVSVYTKKANQVSFVSKVITISDFQENGLGVYEVLFSATDLNTVGIFLYVVNSNGALPPPPIREFVGQAFIELAPSLSPGPLPVPLNSLTGYIMNLNGSPAVGAAVSARILNMPDLVGIYPNIALLTTNMITAVTDSNGFFSLEVVQGAVVDISIPRANYRRTLTVPANITDKLFEIP